MYVFHKREIRKFTFSRAVMAKQCTKTRDARAKVLFCFSRVFHRLNSLTGYFIYTEPFNIFARFTRNWRSRLSSNLIQHSDRAQLWKADAFDGKGNENSRTPISKTTTLHVHHAFLYTSLPLLHDYDVKLPYFTISRLNGGQELKDNDFIFVFFTLIRHLPSILSEPACQPAQSYREFPY